MYGLDVLIVTSTTEKRRIGSFIPLQTAINVKSEYAVYNSLTAGESCILPAVSLELSKHQTHIYIPP